MGITDIRFVDLMPDVPMVEDTSVLEVYADRIGMIERLEGNIRITYITWGYAHGSAVLRRVPVIKITRPAASFFGGKNEGGVVAMIDAGPPVDLRATHPLQ